jgi:hypothetical protein
MEYLYRQQQEIISYGKNNIKSKQKAQFQKCN